MLAFERTSLLREQISCGRLTWHYNHAGIESFKVQERPVDFNVANYKKFIDRVSDSTSQLTFKELPHVEFWCPIEEKYPALSERATKVLSSFLNTYLCDARFSSYV